jgi:sortase A
MKRLVSALSAVLLASGVVQGARGGWIKAKACLAQVLLQKSWQRTLEGGVEQKPWPWADTWPVARLTIPGEERHIVLAGASGRNLAFAPGHLHGSAEPGEAGTCVIAGHRDTHFAELDRLEEGHEILLEDAAGQSFTYRVTGTGVVHEKAAWAISGGADPTLVLVTCWPLDSPRAGGPLRFVVWAEAGGG